MEGCSLLKDYTQVSTNCKHKPKNSLSVLEYFLRLSRGEIFILRFEDLWMGARRPHG